MQKPTYSRKASDVRFAARKTLMRALQNPQLVFPAVHASPPTVAWSGPGGSSPISSALSISYASPRITDLGALPSYNDSSQYETNVINSAGAGSTFAKEFDYYGTDLCILIRDSNASITDRSVWVWVDGQPTTASTASASGVTASSGGTFRMRLTWGSAARRRVRVFLRGPHSFRGLETEPTGMVSPTPKPNLSIAFLGDSWLGGANASNDGVYDIDAIPFLVARMLNAECYNAGQGGTGYVNPGTGNNKAYTDSGRLSAIVSANPSLIIIFGSINDDSYTGGQIQTAAASVYSYFATNLPNTPVVVVGPQSAAATTTIAAARFTDKAAVQAAAAAAPNVLGFIDPVGGGSALPSAWASSVAYVVGDYQGAVYVCLVAHTSSGTFDRARFDPASWLTGTGYSGSTNASGNRDVLLSNDNVHPTAAGAIAYASRIVASLGALLPKV
jgi:lysophospholipase L1-like esterase